MIYTKKKLMVKVKRIKILKGKIERHVLENGI
jgi:hypothetical protein